MEKSHWTREMLPSGTNTEISHPCTTITISHYLLLMKYTTLFFNFFKSMAVFVDPEFLADVQEWKKSLANFSSQVVGQTQVFLNGSAEECRFRECNLGNLICDAMVRKWDVDK